GRRKRCCGGGIPTSDGRSRTLHAQQRAGDRQDRAARHARDYQLIRRCRSEDHEMEKSLRRQRGATRARRQTSTSRTITAKKLREDRRMRKRSLACTVAALTLFVATASAHDKVKLAIGQRGNWDTSVSEIGQLAGIFGKHELELDMSYTNGCA